MMTECLCQYVLQLSHENEHEGPLPDCTISVKESESEHFRATPLTVMAHIVHIHMLQSRLLIKDYSIAYFDHIAEFKVPYH